MWPGLYDDAVREHKTAMRLSPYSPHAVRIGLGQALMLQGQDEEALAELEAVLDDDLSPFSEAWARRVMAIVLDALGRQDEARETVAKMVEVFPAWTIAWDSGATRAFRDREMIAAQHDTLRRLGLPE
jgi:predicted Zn-dependent protease